MSNQLFVQAFTSSISSTRALVVSSCRDTCLHFNSPFAAASRLLATQTNPVPIHHTHMPQNHIHGGKERRNRVFVAERTVLLISSQRTQGGTKISKTQSSFLPSTSTFLFKIVKYSPALSLVLYQKDRRLKEPSIKGYQNYHNYKWFLLINFEKLDKICNPHPDVSS